MYCLGWDISSLDLGQAMERAEVIDWDLQEQLRPHMSQLKPRASIYIPEFIAANQSHRADNLIQGTKAEQVQVGIIVNGHFFPNIFACHIKFSCIVILNSLFNL